MVSQFSPLLFLHCGFMVHITTCTDSTSTVLQHRFSDSESELDPQRGFSMLRKFILTRGPRDFNCFDDNEA